MDVLTLHLLIQVKALEQQLESEHEERIHFVREKHDLETKIMNLQELASRSTDEDQVAVKNNPSYIKSTFLNYFFCQTFIFNSLC